MAADDKLREYLKRVTVDLHETRTRLREVEAQRHEPVAIVGMACRYPGGATSPERLWELVDCGRDAVSAFPIDRGWAGWQIADHDHPRASLTGEGGFLYDLADFDASFFGISPREALAMDPQQRLLLEASWEAVEDAQIDPFSLRRSPTGVFTGVTDQDYGRLMFGPIPSDLEGYVGTGNALSVASGRVSYSLGLEGPAVTIDTACSSSLVALHLACGALRARECSLALASGVTVLATPTVFAAIAAQGGLASDGRCKAFAEGADGVGWGEGVGVLALELLSDAQRNGRRVLAVVRGSAVNQDGASNGLTAPNGPSQRRVIRQALEHAGLSGAEVDAVEAHGTGTPLGDPIEAQALLATYGQDRGDCEPLQLGSIKSNIGHTQAAAGMAGVIKMVMGMRHGVLAKTLHAQEPSSKIDWSAGSVSLLSEARPWPDRDGTRRAGVSSFGVSGTNAHVILEQAPGQARDAGTWSSGMDGTTAQAVSEQGAASEPGERQPAAIVPSAKSSGLLGGGLTPWVLSGHSAEALRGQARLLGSFVATDEGLPVDAVGHALAGRAVFDRRAVVFGKGRADLLESLGALAAGRPGAGVVEGEAGAAGTGVVFVFPGQGGQWAGMADGLLASSPVFAERMRECAEALAQHVDWSLEDVLRAAPGAPGLERLDVLQPVMFSMMVSLAELWAACGVRPAAVIGHSQGEVAAACVAGCLSLEDAARVVALRSRILSALVGHGRIVSLAVAHERARELLEGWEGRAWITAVNGPSSVAVTGDEKAIEQLLRACAEQEIRTREIPATVASHSPLVEPLREETLEALAGIVPAAGDVRFHSTVTAGPLDPLELGADYWYRNMRQPVQFEPTVRGLLDSGYRTFVEIGPHPSLKPALQETLDDVAGAGGELGELSSAGIVGSLHRGQGGPERFLASVGEAWAHGVEVDWSAILEGCALPHVDLPKYAFQRTRYWYEAEQPRPREGSEESALDRVRYRIAWKPVGEHASTLTGRWLLVVAAASAQDPWVADVVAAMHARGAEVVQVERADSESIDREALAAGIRQACVDEDAIELSGVLSLLALDERLLPGHAAVSGGLAGTVELVQALEDAAVQAPLWMVTREAVSVGADGDHVAFPLQAMVSGLGRTLALEQPQRWGGTLDLPARIDDRVGERLCGALAATGAEDQLAIRAAGVFARRLLHHPVGGELEGGAWSVEGTILVTGGTGGLGGQVARRLAREGARHLLLVGRRGPQAPDAAELKSELEELGADVRVVACDVSEREQLEELLASIAPEHPLEAIVHAAGVGSMAALDSLDLERLQQTLAPKSGAALHLHELTAHMSLSAFVLFSSMGATMGSGGQGDYVAANAYLDALAEHRRALGLAATSVAWGAWAGEGMAAQVGELFRRRGVLDMQPELTIDVLQQALELDETCLTVADVDWERYAPLYTSARARPLIAELPEVQRMLREADALDSELAAGALASRLVGLSGRERERVALELVRVQAAAVLGHVTPEAVERTRAFRELGFDSLMAVELRNKLQAATGLRLPTTLVFERPTPVALAGYLIEEALGSDPHTGAAIEVRAGASLDEPIAIVGMSCSYPGGVRSPDDLWELVAGGVDAIGALPIDRGWDLDALYDPDPNSSGTSYAREGGFVYDAAEFDAAFFGIGPREARAMDPQQRLLLEACWEALEHASIDPLSLRGSQTGVYVGVSPQFYGIDALVSSESDGYGMTGGALSVVSGRVSYTLGLEGPAVTVDTACSSSLVALHLACGALRAGECQMALAGGVTVMAAPAVFVEFSRQRGMAPDGRCKSFADAADGAGWGEGVGVLALERLSDAERLGHQVLAIVRGSAINQDGASNGLAAPNGLSQQRVIRQALTSAGLSADQVDAVEAHGTGTTLGDPIEAQALLATYGRERPPERGPLWVGSIKSNIGHPQNAAGVAGVIKMVMALQNETLPKTLHVDEPSKQVDWSMGDVSLLTEARPWSANGKPRRAGVSSFGVSGTNAHVILEQAPKPEVERPSDPPSLGEVPWLLSGRDSQALRDQARHLLERARGEPDLSPVDIGYTLAVGRAALDSRAVVIGGHEDLLSGLDALARGESVADLIAGSAGDGEPQVAFLFTGQGAQRLGMGQELYEAMPAFREAFDAVLEHMDALLGRSLREIVFAVVEPDEESPEAGLLDETMFTQAALFALEVSLFRALEDLGVQPDHLVGHSIGELAAAHVAGVLSLADACALVVARGRLMGALPPGGAMIAVQASEAEVLEGLKGLEDRVALAAVNGPTAVVLSGDEDAVLELARAWESRGRKTKRLQVSHAFHSPRMDAMLEDFARVAEGLSFSAPQIPIVSNTTGELATAEELCDPRYWVRHVREPVRFCESIQGLAAHGVTVFLELGPDGVLSAMSQDCLMETTHERDATVDAEPQPLAVPVLRGGRPESRALLSALAQAWVRGVSVDWGKLIGSCGARRVRLPTYAFQRTPYWRESSPVRASLSPVEDGTDHPLLTAAMPLAEGDGWLLVGRLALDSSPWLADHVVMGVVLVPGTTFVEIALRAGALVDCEVLRELVMELPLVLQEGGAAQLQVTVGAPTESGERPVSVHSRLSSESDESFDRQGWIRHATGLLAPADADAEGADGGAEAERQAAALLAGGWPPEGAEPAAVEEMYERMAAVGLDFGPAFTGVRAAWRHGQDVYAEIRLDAGHAQQAPRFGVHPALLDASLQAAAVRMLDSDSPHVGAISIPFAWSGVRLHGGGVDALRIRSSLTQSGEVSLFAVDVLGRPIISIDSLVLRAVSREQLQNAPGARSESLFRVDWSPVAAKQAGLTARAVLLGEEGPPGAKALRIADVEIETYPDLDVLSEALAAGAATPDALLVDCGALNGLHAEIAQAPGAGADRIAGGDVIAVAHATTTRTLALLQRGLADERLAKCQLVFITSGAVAAGADEAVPGLRHAALWGLVRSAQSEHPGRIVLVDVDEGETALELLSQALGGDEPQLAIRSGQLLAPRLERVASQGADRTESVEEAVGGADPDRAASEQDAGERERFGTVLITGGTGDLGGRLARHLVLDHSVATVLLASRRGGLAPGAEQLTAELEALGAEVTIVACDVSDRAQLQQLIESIPAERPLRMVVHAAGVLDDGVIESLTAERVDSVLAPKLDAAWHLHELTEHLDLEAFVLFSSAAGVFGGPGQASYAAANAFLDALAAHRRAHGLTATSLAWGMWAQQDGMAGRLEAADRQRMSRAGVLPLSADEGLQLFDLARATQEGLLLPVRFDSAALRTQARAGWVHPLLRRLVRMPVRAPSSDGGASLAQRLAGVAEGEREQVVLDLVRAEVAIVLGHASVEAVEVRRAFNELGFDSLAATELRNRLCSVTGLRLPATLVFDYPTPAVLAKYLLTSVAPDAVAVRAPATPSMPANEPIAIVGLSCRYPGGVRSPQELWDLLSSGRDAISEFPIDRGWDLERLYDPDQGRAGTSYVHEGGFVHDAGDFDPGFFKISPREALVMDPQQRLLLEACWEALEDGGIDPLSLAGSQTGVFAGVMYQDYLSNLFSGAAELDGYATTGNGASVVTGRVAYTLGLEGPAVTVDTACSSSLVAMHLACQALRAGECSLALAGGVSVMATPMPFVAFSQQGALAPDGRSKSFADAADGVSWGEGVGVTLLERLSDARRLGHDVLAVVRGSAINQDGASNGLMAPNGPSQQRVIRQALASAGLSAEQVDAVDAHGTGTTLGDPIEAQALLATYGQRRTVEHPLRLGSIKSNLGHTQAAAGVAGVLKMVLALQHEVLPRTLHVDAPSRHVEWSQGAVSLLTEAEPWVRNGEPRRAGVSSFGLSGTNAHLIIEEAPAPKPFPADTPTAEGQDTTRATPLAFRGGVAPWILSAPDTESLLAQAARLRGFMAGSSAVGSEERVPGEAASEGRSSRAEAPEVGASQDRDSERSAREVRVGDVSLSLAKRSAFECRAVVLGDGRAELMAGVSALAGGGSAAEVVRGTAADRTRVAFLFPGQGSQWNGMATELLDTSPVFAEWIDRCGEALAPHVGWLLRDVLSAQAGAPGLERVDVVQPVLFAMMVSLAKLWEACGASADLVVGHSQGEIAAVCVAGGLSLEDAAQVIALRSRALVELQGHGGMVALSAGAREVKSTLARFDDRISVAAVNGPSAVVVSGDRDALDELMGDCEREGIRARRIAVDYAAHSPHVEAIREELLEGCSGIAPLKSRVPFYSSVTGASIDTTELDAGYWYRNLRETVQFEQVTRTLLGQGCRTFVETGPHPVLSVAVHETADSALERSGDVLVAASLRRDEPHRFVRSLSEAWVGGVSVDWDAIVDREDARSVRLPTYAFQRERYWLKAAPARVGDAVAFGQISSEHPLLGAAIAPAGETGLLFTGRISLETHPWLADHAVSGVVLLPGTAFLDLALHAGRQLGCDCVRELTLQAPLALHDPGGVQLQVRVGSQEEDAARALSIHARPEATLEDGGPDSHEWTCHATGRLATRGVDEQPARHAAGASLERWPPEGAHSVEIGDLYDRLADWGLDYGPVFQGLQAVWLRDEQVFAEVGLAEGQVSTAARYELHPALLDAALHASAVGMLTQNGAAQTDSDGVGIRLPFSWNGVQVHQTGPSSLRVCLSPVGADAVSLTVADGEGGLVASIDSLRTRSVSAAQLSLAGKAADGLLYCLNWTDMAIGATPDQAAGETALVGIGRMASDHIAEHLRRTAGVRVKTHSSLAAVSALADGELGVSPIVLVSCASCCDVASLDEEGLGSGAQGSASTDVQARAVRTSVHEMLALLQEWLADERLADSRLVLLTQGAVAVEDDEDLPDPGGASVGGLLRSAQMENPGRFLHVDLDVEQSSWRVLAAALDTALRSNEPQFALRKGMMLVPRLARVSGEPAGTPAIDGTVLITGGTGGLGGLLAKHLASRREAAALILTSRRGIEAPGARELEAELCELGAHVRIVACDVTDRDELAQLIDSVEAERPLRAVVHAAGVMEDATIGSLTVEQVDRVFAPKVDGARHLHELTRDLELSDFILFSSATATFGSPGQGAYAAANAFLDALAAHRRGRGLPATAMAWGLWAQTTEMTAGVGEEELARAARSGILALSVEQGLDLFDAARQSGSSLVIPVNLDVAVFSAHARTGRLPALLRGLVRARESRSSRGASGSLAVRVARAPADERAEVVLGLVRTEVAELLGHPSPDAVRVERPFLELGFDSLTAVELRNRLNYASGLQLPSTLVFDHPSPEEVASVLLSRLEASDVEHVGENGSLQRWSSAPDAAPLAELGGVFGSLLTEARARGMVGEFVAMLTTAARLRPVFQFDDAADRAPEPITLSNGPAGARLVCVPSLLATSGPHQYARFASAFRGVRDVIALPLCGFLEGEPLPATMEAAVEAQAQAVRGLVAPDEPVVLAGHSTGGAFALAVAARLEGLGAPPGGVVLIDTYSLEGDGLEHVLDRVLEGMLEREGAYAPLSDTRLTAMALYLQMLDECETSTVQAPTLLLKAAEPMPGLSVEQVRRQAWGSSDVAVEVPGNHFTVMEQHAAAAAAAVGNWLESVLDH